jgi:hypothetical protein
VVPLELKRFCVSATAVGLAERVAARLTAEGAIRLRVARKVIFFYQIFLLSKKKRKKKKVWSKKGR